MGYPSVRVEDRLDVPRPASVWAQSPWGTRTKGRSDVPGSVGAWAWTQGTHKIHLLTRRTILSSRITNSPIGISFIVKVIRTNYYYNLLMLKFINTKLLNQNLLCFLNLSH